MNKPAHIKSVSDELEAMDRDTLHQAMARAFAEIEAATKDSTNPHFRSKYADLSSVIAAIKPALVGNGLFFTQCCQPADGGVSVETYVHHRNGENLSLGTIYVPANKQDAQGYGSAITYARRYALQTGFGVPTEDDDGNAAAASASRATARPTTGEEPPRKTKLDGLYDTVPKLEAAAKAFTRTLRSIGSIDEYKEWAKDKEVIAFVEQCKRDLPGWWFGGEGCPPDFTPLSIEVEQTKRGLKEIAELENQ